MNRLLPTLLILTVLFIHSAGTVLALTLNKIGTTTVTSSSITSWYYQGSNPVFSGTADPSAAVSISISGVTNSTTADSSGAWTYTPTTLGQTGVYPIVLSSGSQTMSFNLDITSASSTASALSTTKGGTMSGSVEMPDTLPQSGGSTQTIAVIVAGLLLVTGGMLFYWKVVPRLLFTEEVNEE